MAGELVGGGRKAGVSGVLLVLGGVAVRLTVLNPHAHGEGLGLQADTTGVEHGEGVPGGVAGAQGQVGTGKGSRTLWSLRGNAGQAALPDVQVRQAGFKADVRPQAEQLPAQIFQNGVQVVGAHMGLGVGQNVLRRPAGHQLLQNEAVARVFGAGVQLSVGEGAGAALAELDIGGGVQRAGGPEALHIRLPRLHGTAPLQQDGPQARPGQHQGAEETRRSCSHHHRRPLRRGPGGGKRVGGPGDRETHPFAAASPRGGGLVFDGDLHGVNHEYPVPGVHTAAEDTEGENICLPDPQQPGGLRGEAGSGGAGGELDVFDFQQACHAPFLRRCTTPL